MASAGASPAPDPGALERVLPRVAAAHDALVRVAGSLGATDAAEGGRACDLEGGAPDGQIADCVAWLRSAAAKMRSRAAVASPYAREVATYVANTLAGVSVDLTAVARAPSPHRVRTNVVGDGTLVQVTPTRPLESGSRVVVEALLGDRVVRAPVTAGAGAGLSAGSLTTAADGPRAAGLADALARAAAGLPNAAPAGAMQMSLPDGHAAETIPDLTVVIRDATDLPANESVAVGAPAVALQAWRQRVRATECADTLTGERQPAGTLMRLGVPSVDTRARRGGAETLTPVMLSVLVLTPSRAGPDTPVVVGIHGHEQDAAAMALTHGQGITDEGMILVALDLPGHGGRTAEGRFLDRSDPTGLAANLRQSIVDVLAVVAALRCGIPLADGTRVGRGPVRLLGYSVGAIVATAVRAVERDVETTVLLAPGGDLFEWLGLWIAADLGIRPRRCLGGPDEGAPCEDACRAPGVCFVNPAMARLSDALRVPYGQLLGMVEPMAFAGSPHAEATRGRALLVTGGRDFVMHPEVASRLADAYGMRPPSGHMRRGVHTILVQWPTLGHDLPEDPRVRRQAYRFLATGGRELEPVR